MALEKLEQDLNIVAKLDDEPNDVGGLTAAELKAKFDAAPKAIQEYINNVLIPGIESMAVPGAGDFKADGSVPMSGVLNMNGNRVVLVPTPESDTDAANKLYVDGTADRLEKTAQDKQGAPGGTATLDGTGKLPAEQLPTYTGEEALSAGTKELYGLEETATPDQVFRQIDVRLGNLGSISSLVIERIDESTTWVAPKALKQRFTVFAVGGGYGGDGGAGGPNGGGGGGGGYGGSGGAGGSYSAYGGGGGGGLLCSGGDGGAPNGGGGGGINAGSSYGAGGSGGCYILYFKED